MGPLQSIIGSGVVQVSGGRSVFRSLYQEKLTKVEGRIHSLCATQTLLSRCLRNSESLHLFKLTEEEKSVLNAQIPGREIAQISPQEIRAAIRTVLSEVAGLEEAKEILKIQKEDPLQSPEFWRIIIPYAENPREKRKWAGLSTTTRQAALLDFKKDIRSAVASVSQFSKTLFVNIIGNVEKMEKVLQRPLTQEEKTAFDEFKQRVHGMLERECIIRHTFETEMGRASNVRQAQECCDTMKWALAECITGLRSFKSISFKDNELITLEDLESEFYVPVPLKERAPDFLQDILRIEAAVFARDKLIEKDRLAEKTNRDVMSLRFPLEDVLTHVRSFSVARSFLDHIHTKLSKETFSEVVSGCFSTNPGVEKVLRKQVADYCLMAFHEIGPLFLYLEKCNLDEQLSYLETIEQILSSLDASVGSINSLDRIRKILIKMAEECLQKNRFLDLEHLFAVRARHVKKGRECFKNSPVLLSTMLAPKDWEKLREKYLSQLVEREERQKLLDLLSKCEEMGEISLDTSEKVRSCVYRSLTQLSIKKEDLSQALKYAQYVLLTDDVHNELYKALLAYVQTGGGTPPIPTANIHRVLGWIFDLKAVKRSDANDIEKFKFIFLTKFISKCVLPIYLKNKDPLLLEFIFKAEMAIPSRWEVFKDELREQLMPKVCIPSAVDEEEIQDHFPRYRDGIARVVRWIQTFPKYEQGLNLFAVGGNIFQCFRKTQNLFLLEIALGIIDEIPVPVSEQLSRYITDMAIPYVLDESEHSDRLCHFGRYIDTCHRLFQKVDCTVLRHHYKCEEFHAVFAKCFKEMQRSTPTLAPDEEDKTKRFQAQLDILQELKERTDVSLLQFVRIEDPAVAREIARAAIEEVD